MSGPLHGIKVVDFCQYINGPSATGQLCENGATVLKIEPKTGEGMRHASGGPGLMHPGLEMYNRGKLSMTLDLKHPGAPAVVERLVRWADVLTENFRHGIMEKLGYSYEVCAKWNPKLIYASNSGFGAAGEWAKRPSYDGMSQAFTGVLTSNGGGPSHMPRELGWTFSDVVGGDNFVVAILSALVARGRTGKGQKYFQRVAIARSLNQKQGAQPDDGNTEWKRTPFQQLHKASDGKWVCATVTQMAQFTRFCEDVLGRPDLMTASLKKRWPGAQPDDAATLIAEVAAVIATQPSQHWIDRMVAANVPCAPVASYRDVGDEDHTVGKHLFANNYLVRGSHRDYGTNMRWLGVPTHFSDTPAAVPGPGESWHCPHIGEHSEDMLVHALGYSATEVEQLVESGVVPRPSGAYEERASRDAREKYAATLRRKNAAAEAKAKPNKSRL